MVCKKIIYTGHVQGVGFRYRTLKIAENFTVTGYVKNLADGGVEVVAQGDVHEVEQFLASITERMGHYIRETAVSDAPKQRYFSFSIEY